jgi:soluble cytochrome b562
MFINHGAQIAFAKSLLDVVMDSAKDTKRTLSRAEESDEPEEQEFAQEALDEFAKTLDEAAKSLKHIDMSIYECRRNGRKH